MKKSFSRRDFLKKSAACACGSLLAPGLAVFAPQNAYALSCGGRRKVIVHVFLDGGPHAPSILVPKNTQAYFDRHPTLKILALSFLLLIGVSLIAEGFGQHIRKGYIYFAMGFSVFVEMINLRVHARQPVHLHQRYAE